MWVCAMYLYALKALLRLTEYLKMWPAILTDASLILISFAFSYLLQSAGRMLAHSTHTQKKRDMVHALEIL